MDVLALESSGLNSNFQVVGCSPNEGKGEEMDQFWNNMDRTVDRGANGYRLCILGDLNRWMGWR